MARIIELPTFEDKRGKLSVLEDKQIPFKIKRLFYIYEAGQYPRGGASTQKNRSGPYLLEGEL